jgi:hypothetical protein
MQRRSSGCWRENNAKQMTPLSIRWVSWGVYHISATVAASPPDFFIVEGANFGWAHWWRVPASRKQHDPFPLLGHSNLLSNAQQLWCLHCDALCYFDVYFDIYIYINYHDLSVLRSFWWSCWGSDRLTVMKHAASLLSRDYLRLEQTSCS